MPATKKKAKATAPIADEAIEFRVRARISADLDESGRVRVHLVAAVVNEVGEVYPSTTGSDAIGSATFTPTLFYRSSPRKPAPTDEEVAAYVRKVRDDFIAQAPSLVASTADTYLNGAANLNDKRSDPDAYDEEEVIADALREFEYQLRQALGAPRPGTRSKWTAITLSRAVRDALAELRPSRLRTLENVAEVLKKRHADIAPKSGEALRKLLTRLEVDWQKLKDEADT